VNLVKLPPDGVLRVFEVNGYLISNSRIEGMKSSSEGKERLRKRGGKNERRQLRRRRTRK